MAITLGVHASEGTDDGNTTTTAAIDTASGSVDFLLLAWSDYVIAAAVVSDSQSNTWDTSPATQASVAKINLAFKIAPSKSASHTFTASNTSSFPAIAALAWTGVKQTSPLDQQNGFNNNTGSTIQPGSITPTEDNCLILCAIATNSLGVNSPTIDSGFSVVEDQIDHTTQNFGLTVAYKVQTTAAAVNPTWTTAGVYSGGAATVIASFKAAAVSALVGKSLLRTRQAVNRASTY